jgi:hypothetical protein
MMRGDRPPRSVEGCDVDALGMVRGDRSTPYIRPGTRTKERATLGPCGWFRIDLSQLRAGPCCNPQTRVMCPVEGSEVEHGCWGVNIGLSRPHN